jgi:hypothetical protein
VNPVAEDVSAPIKPMASTNIHRIIRTALVVAIISFLWTLVMPGIVAGIGGVFYREGVLRKLPEKIQNQVKEFNDEQARLKGQIVAVDVALAKAVAESPAAVPGLLQFRNHTDELLRKSTPEISVVPFHLNPILLLFPVLYTCLGWLTIIFAPPRSGALWATLRSPWFWIVGALIYVLFEWPLWVRNFVLTNEGRTVYAYPNFDVHPGSFVAQEFIIAGFALLLSLLWSQWIAYYATIRDGLKTEGPAFQEILRGIEAQELKAMFIRWQIASVILALGFLFFTYTYWTLVAGYRDQRYLLSAIMSHLLWAVSWALLSMPLFAKWRHWSTLRRQAIAEISKTDLPIDERRFAVDSILNLHPLSSVSMSVSGVVSAVSFILPLFHLGR